MGAGADKRVCQKAMHVRGGGNFWHFCFEVVHFGAKVTNAACTSSFVFGGGEVQ